MCMCMCVCIYVCVCVCVCVLLSIASLQKRVQVLYSRQVNFTIFNQYRYIM